MSTREARDFGGLIRATPRRVVRARSESDLVAALADARRLGLPVTIRGAGHSCAGQTVSDDGMLVINRSDANATRRMAGSDGRRLADDEVELSGRARWRVVERELHRAGRRIPVLADFLDLTVGGTLSVGGYGVESVVHGVQADHVTRLRLVLPDGRAVWCSPDECADLFQFALAGLGQVGVIERAVVRTVPYRRFTTLFVYKHRDLAELIASIAWMSEPGAELPDFFKAQDARGRVISIYGAHANTWREALAARSPRALADRPVARRLFCPTYRSMRDLSVRAWLARFAGHTRLWSDYLLDHAGLTEFGESVSQAWQRDAYAGCLKCVYIVAIRRLPRVVEFPFEAAGGVNRGTERPAPSMTFGVGLYSMIPHGRPAAVDAVRRASADALTASLRLGGRPYLYGWHELSQDRRTEIYGPACERLAALRRELDPGDVFQPDKFCGGAPGVGARATRPRADG